MNKRAIQISLSLQNCRVALLIGLLLCLSPAVAAWFESSMARHMLIQFPLLAVCGAWLFHRQYHTHRVLARLDPLGAISLVLGSGCMLFWMIPLHLDLATIDPWFRFLKVITVPMGIGACFYWVIVRSNTLVRLVVAFEAWAAIARLGWIYVESPDQLCSSYLIGEQQFTGMVLLSVAALIGIAAMFWGLFGSFEDSTSQQSVVQP